MFFVGPADIVGAPSPPETGAGLRVLKRDTANIRASTQAGTIFCRVGREYLRELHFCPKSNAGPRRVPALQQSRSNATSPDEVLLRQNPFQKFHQFAGCRDIRAVAGVKLMERPTLGAGALRKLTERALIGVPHALNVGARQR